jgi:hypothetical protein
MPSSLPSALVVAHPGHELRVFGWVEATRPRVYVLTDGSGRGGRSRLPATTRILAETGAVPAGIYGRLTDHDAYDAITVINRPTAPITTSPGLSPRCRFRSSSCCASQIFLNRSVSTPL